MALIRGVLGAALVGLTFGGYPAKKWWSAAIAVALCVAAAFALHFVAP
jgi:CBS-domain-containing membrane protein